MAEFEGKGLVDIAALAVSALALGWTFIRGQRRDAGELAALTTRVLELEEQTDLMKREIADVKIKVSVLPEMNTKLSGLDRLVSHRLDRVDKDNERIFAKLDELLKPPTRTARP